MQTSDYVIKVKDLSFSYGKHKVIDDISFSINKGQITTIMGANGCGKSTLFSLLTKNLKEDKGVIKLEDKDINKISLQHFAQKVSIVHQYNTCADDITVEQLVSYGRIPHKKIMGGYTEQDYKLIEWAMAVTNLTEYKDKEVGKLSGGQRQRVWIAMALAQNTKVLFLDEPTTYLDIKYQLEILNLVKLLNEEYGITIIMILHDINQAIHYSHNIIGLKDGKIIVNGNSEEVITSESINALYDIDLEVSKISDRKFVVTV